MSRSGYSDDLEPWALIKWRGQVTSAIRGKRGQAFLRELLAALDALPYKALIVHEIKGEAGAVCALGSVAVARHLDAEKLDPYDHEGLGEMFNVAHQLIQEIEYENDESCYRPETPEQRWQRMRSWVASHIKEQA